jgi:hypothetical protein
MIEFSREHMNLILDALEFYHLYGRHTHDKLAMLDSTRKSIADLVASEDLDIPSESISTSDKWYVHITDCLTVKPVDPLGPYEDEYTSRTNAILWAKRKLSNLFIPSLEYTIGTNSLSLHVNEDNYLTFIQYYHLVWCPESISPKKGIVHE